VYGVELNVVVVAGMVSITGVGVGNDIDIVGCGCIVTPWDVEKKSERYPLEVLVEDVETG